MKIGIDCDSVLNDLDVAWAKWIGEVRGSPFTVADMTHWNVHETSGLGLRVYDFLKIAGMFENLNPRDGAVAGVTRLWEAGHSLYVVTNVIGHDYVEKQRFLRRHFPMLSEKNIVATTHKHLLKLDALIDDGIHNHEGFEGLRVLFDRPWNRETPQNAPALGRILPYERADGWGDVVTTVERFGVVLGLK